MELLVQKYIKYFYMTLICGILWQLLDVIVVSLNKMISYDTVILMILSLTNLVLIISSMRHNMKQEFTECKATASISRFTIALLLIFQAYVCFKTSASWIALGNHIMTVFIVEGILNYRIKTIEHLEHLANRYSQDEDHILLK